MRKFINEVSYSGLLKLLSLREWILTKLKTKTFAFILGAIYATVSIILFYEGRELKNYIQGGLDIVNTRVISLSQDMVESVSADSHLDSDSEKGTTPEAIPDYSTGIFSAYTADENQTDDSPTIMANNQKVFVGAIANNCLEFGTEIEVNNKTYLVSDRMNKRYDCDHFDIYFEDYDEAIKFGRQELEYIIK